MEKDLQKYPAPLEEVVAFWTRLTEQLRSERAIFRICWLPLAAPSVFNRSMVHPSKTLVIPLRLAAIAALPPHYVGLSGNSPTSAEAIRSAEASLVTRARRRQRVWGGAWEDVMRLAVQVQQGAPVSGMDELETVWANPETRTVAQAADAAVKLYAAGVIDRRAALEDIGYTPAQIERMTGSQVVA